MGRGKGWVILVLVAILGGVSTAGADFYTYRDRNGVTCIVDSREAIPPHYRARAKLVRDQDLQRREMETVGKAYREPATTAPVPPSLQQSPATPEPARAPLGRFPWLSILGTVAGIVALFFVLVKLCTRLPSPQLAKVIYLAFFLGIFTFVYKVYTDSLVNGYFSVKTRVIKLFEKANVREAAPPPGMKGLDGDEGTTR